MKYWSQINASKERTRRKEKTKHLDFLYYCRLVCIHITHARDIMNKCYDDDIVCFKVTLRLFIFLFVVFIFEHFFFRVFLLLFRRVYSLYYVRTILLALNGWIHFHNGRWFFYYYFGETRTNGFGTVSIKAFLIVGSADVWF